MAERGRKGLVYKGNRLHIFPLVSEQVQWSQHKAGKKGNDVVVCLECHPGLGSRERWPGGSVCFYNSGAVVMVVVVVARVGGEQELGKTEAVKLRGKKETVC